MTETGKKPGVAAIALSLGAAAILLTVIQAPFNMSFLAWVAIVPFIIVVSSSVRAGPLFVWAYIVGLVYWLANIYWVMNVTAPGWISLSLYLALYWPVTAFALRLCNYRKVPLWASVPVLFTGAEALQGWVFTGFAWRFLAHSQYANPRIIQIADIFGAAGVSFLIALVNALVASVIITSPARRASLRTNLGRLAAAVSLVAAALVYGHYRVNETGRCVEPGPMVAAVQSNVPQSVKESGKAADLIFADLLSDSNEAMAASPALIVWPETMVMAYLNPDLLAWLPQDSPERQFDAELRRFASRGAYLLAGASAASPQIRGNDVVIGDRFNSAFLYTPDGRQSPARYDKMHLVPFGEYVPFRHSIPWLYRLLMRLTPYDYEYTLTAGTSPTRFEIRSAGGAFGFGVLICYEDTTPEVARRLVYDPDGSKQLDWLVNISNDGWFVRETREDILPTTELSQHTAICVFRAVENRVSILRSVNTGISTLIDSAGQIRNDPVAGSLPVGSFERQAVSGWFADRIGIDPRHTFFGAHGRWLNLCCALAFVASIMAPLAVALVAKRKRTAL